IQGASARIVANAGFGSSTAGDITVNANDVTIIAGGEISTGSHPGTGAGGNINVTAKNKLLIDGTGFTETFEFSPLFGRPIFVGPGILASGYSSGGAGNVTVQAPALSIIGDGQIAAATYGTG